MDITAFSKLLVGVVFNPLIVLVFALGLLLFIVGVVEYIWSLSSNADSKESGKQHMLWGLVGMFIMFSAYTIVHIVASSFNVSLPRY